MTTTLDRVFPVEDKDVRMNSDRSDTSSSHWAAEPCRPEPPSSSEDWLDSPSWRTHVTTAVTASTAVTTVNVVAPVRSPGRSPAAEPCLPVVESEPPGMVEEEDWLDMMDREMADLLDSPSYCEHSEVESVDSDQEAVQCVNCKRILSRFDVM